MDLPLVDSAAKVGRVGKSGSSTPTIPLRTLPATIQSLRDNHTALLQTIAATLEEWMDPIACMCRFVRDNGITECFHRKMKLIQRRAYGFRNFENYQLRVVA